MESPLRIFVLAGALVGYASAAVVGTNPPALSIAAERIAHLPAREQAAWKAYLERSARQRTADRAFLEAEARAAGLKEALTPPSGSGARSIPMERPAEWYSGTDARRIADIVVSFQTPAGGWSKNLNLADHARRAGESFAPNNLSRFLAPGDFDAPRDERWEYVGTLDNDATTTELEFLAKVITTAGANDSARHRASFARGLDYLFAAQFPNGGWPQVWPLEGGYHDAITFNDGAVIHATQLLESVAEAHGDFAFVSPAMRRRAGAGAMRGIRLIAAAQIVENGRRTVWGQQHDPFTLQPVSGRNYEPPAQCSSESADVMQFLMNLPKPDAATIAAVDAAAAWFRKTAIHGEAYVRAPEGAHLTPASEEATIWARFYEIGSGRPIFGDRDKSIHDDVTELSRERRNGYSWYNSAPLEALARYAKWRVEHR